MDVRRRAGTNDDPNVERQYRQDVDPREEILPGRARVRLGDFPVGGPGTGS